MKNNKYLIGLCIISLVFALNLIVAFSPISSYSEERPLTLYPGQEKEVIINILPTPEEGTVKVEASIIESANVASITDDSKVYDASAGAGNEGLVHIKVKVPSTATIGSEYIIKSKFVNKNSPLDSGTIGLSVESTNVFKVVVVARPTTVPKSEGLGLVWWILGGIIVLVIIILIWTLFANKNRASAPKSKSGK
jgi:hypothetical protein